MRRHLLRHGDATVVAKTGVRVVELAALFARLRLAQRCTAVVAEFGREVVIGVAFVAANAGGRSANSRRRQSFADGSGHITNRIASSVNHVIGHVAADWRNLAGHVASDGSEEGELRNPSTD